MNHGTAEIKAAKSPQIDISIVQLLCAMVPLVTAIAFIVDHIP